MRRPLSVFMVLVLLLVTAGCQSPTAATQIKDVPQPTDKPPRNIILIGWDGAQRNHLKEALARQELPNLQKLSSEGSLVAIDVLRVTDTKAGWSQILTGYEPEITGVFSNSRYQPIPKGLSIFERLEQFFGPENIVTAAIIGKKGHIDADPPQKIAFKGRTPIAAGPQEGEIVVENGQRYRVTPGKPYYYTQSGMDLWRNGLIENAKVGAEALQFLTANKDQRFFLFVHFAEVDHSGHTYGENSKQYNDALISSDTWTGKIMEKLKELKIDGQTLIYVTADHGFDEGMKAHNDAPYVFLATNDPQVKRPGQRVDIAPTILERFGVDISKLQPALDGHSLTRPYAQPRW